VCDSEAMSLGVVIFLLYFVVILGKTKRNYLVLVILIMTSGAFFS